jgi:hypothetical protein
MRAGFKAVAILCCVANLACHSQKSGWPEPGMELYSVAADSVREVLLSSPARKVYAYRWATDRPFQLVIASRDSATAEQCSAGPGFERLLKALATLPVVKESEKHFDDGTAAWADVRLKDTTNLEPIEARIRIPEANSEPVVIQFRDRQYVVRVDPSVLQTATGCAVLGRRQ